MHLNLNTLKNFWILILEPTINNKKLLNIISNIIFVFQGVHMRLYMVQYANIWCLVSCKIIRRRRISYNNKKHFKTSVLIGNGNEDLEKKRLFIWMMNNLILIPLPNQCFKFLTFAIFFIIKHIITTTFIADLSIRSSDHMLYLQKIILISNISFACIQNIPFSFV